jgi:hypothetical protein
MTNHRSSGVALATLAIFLCAAAGPALGVTTFQPGDFVTFTQLDWSGSPMLENATPFATIYPTGLVVGLEGVPNRYFLVFSDGPAVINYLPTADTPAALTANIFNPGAGGWHGPVRRRAHCAAPQLSTSTMRA